MEAILEKLGLGNIIQRFREERVEVKTVPSLTDGELSRLGIVTIGDRVRVRELCAEKGSVPDQDDDPRPSTSTSSNQRFGNLASEISHERNLLFSPRSGSPRTSRGQKRKKYRLSHRRRTWTGQFMCLASRNSSKVPTQAERQVLYSASLGAKKIQFDAEDDEDAFIDKLTGESMGFPKLRDCGGFELLQCLAHSRQLTVIKCPSWSVCDLKAVHGPQAKIYIRPIQVTLDTTPTVSEVTTSNIKERCRGCNEEIPVRELRSHLWGCSAGLDNPSSDEDISSISVQATMPESRENIDDSDPEMSVVEVTVPAVAREARLHYHIFCSLQRGQMRNPS